MICSWVFDTRFIFWHPYTVKRIHFSCLSYISILLLFNISCVKLTLLISLFWVVYKFLCFLLQNAVVTFPILEPQFTVSCWERHFRSFFTSTQAIQRAMHSVTQWRGKGLQRSCINCIEPCLPTQSTETHRPIWDPKADLQYQYTVQYWTLKERKILQD